MWPFVRRRDRSSARATTCALRPRCELGAEWFSERVAVRQRRPAATIHGRPADRRAALARAAELLRGARRPLLHGFDGATVEDARAAVALADRLGALVADRRVGRRLAGRAGAPVARRLDRHPGRNPRSLPAGRDLARGSRGHPPRLLDRLGFGDGSAEAGERTLVVVDDRDTATARRADVRCAGRGARPRGADGRCTSLAARAGAGRATSGRARRAAGADQRGAPCRVRARRRA